MNIPVSPYTPVCNYTWQKQCELLDGQFGDEKVDAVLNKIRMQYCDKCIYRMDRSFIGCDGQYHTFMEIE